MRSSSQAQSRREHAWPLTGGAVLTAGALAGAALLCWTAVIHLILWSGSYQHIPTIGPLFLVQGIAGLLLAGAVVVLRAPVVLASAAVFCLGTLTGLLWSVHFGLFGFMDSLSAPFAVESLVVEAVAAGILMATAVLSVARGSGATGLTGPMQRGPG